MDPEAGIKVNEETRGGKGAGTAIEGRPRLGTRDAGEVAAPTCIASIIAKRTDGRTTGEQPGGRARIGGTPFILFIWAVHASFGASNRAVTRLWPISHAINAEGHAYSTCWRGIAIKAFTHADALGCKSDTALRLLDTALIAEEFRMP